MAMTIEAKALGQSIKEVRKKRELTQRVVAEQMGVTVTYLSLLENGERGASIRTLNNLAEVLQIQTTFLLCFATKACAAGKDKSFAPLIRTTKGAIRALISAESESGK